MTRNKVKVPNVVNGGKAHPLGNNLYYITGKSHEQGGVDIGSNPKTGLEVEGGEIMQMGDKDVKVFSRVNFLGGKSPADLVLEGHSPNKVFKAQERFKRVNGFNDDGSKKALGGELPEVTVTATRRRKPMDYVRDYTYMNLATRIGLNNLLNNPVESIIDDYERKNNYNSRKLKFNLDKNRYKMGGKVYSITVGGKTRLVNVTSTGRRTQAKLGIADKIKKGIAKGFDFLDDKAKELAFDRGNLTDDISWKDAWEQEVSGEMEAKDRKRLIREGKAKEVTYNGKKHLVYTTQEAKGPKGLSARHVASAVRAAKGLKGLRSSNRIITGGKPAKPLKLQETYSAKAVEAANKEIARQRSIRAAREAVTNPKNTVWRNTKAYTKKAIHQTNSGIATGNNKEAFKGAGKIVGPAALAEGAAVTGYNLARNTNSNKTNTNSNKTNYNKVSKANVNPEYMDMVNGHAIGSNLYPVQARLKREGYNSKILANNMAYDTKNSVGMPSWTRISKYKSDYAEVPYRREAKAEETSKLVEQPEQTSTKAEEPAKVEKPTKSNPTKTVPVKTPTPVKSNVPPVTRPSRKAKSKQAEFIPKAKGNIIPNNEANNIQKENERIKGKTADRIKKIGESEYDRTNRVPVRPGVRTPSSKSKSVETPVVKPVTAPKNNVSTNRTPSYTVPRDLTKGVWEDSPLTTEVPKDNTYRKTYDNSKTSIPTTNNGYTSTKTNNNSTRRPGFIARRKAEKRLRNLGRQALINNYNNTNKELGIEPYNSTESKSTSNGSKFPRIKKFFEDKNNTRDFIGMASNIGGSLASSLINRRMLNDLKAPSAPMYKPAAKLKTNININPQLDKMRETAAAYENMVDNNTASSNVALARKQRNRFSNTLTTNELYGTKENLETELINKDKLNQQTVAGQNVDAYNNWQDRVTAFDNTVREKRSENINNVIGNINTGIQDVLARRDARDSEEKTRLAMAATAPNSIEYLYKLGLIPESQYKLLKG